MKLKKARYLLGVVGVILVGVAAFGNVPGEGVPDPLGLPRAEFAKYYRQIVGTDMPDGVISLAIGPNV